MRGREGAEGEGGGGREIQILGEEAKKKGNQGRFTGSHTILERTPD